MYASSNQWTFSFRKRFSLNLETSAKTPQRCVTAPRLPSALRLPSVRRHMRMPAFLPSLKSLRKYTLAAARKVEMKLFGLFHSTNGKMCGMIHVCAKGKTSSTRSQ